jgi:hypothetical protein
VRSGPGGEPLLDRAEALTRADDLVVSGYHAVNASQTNSWRERHGEAKALLERLVDRPVARASSASCHTRSRESPKRRFHLGE